MTTYATLQDLKERVEIADAKDDAALVGALTSASRSVDAYCERVFSVGTAAEARVFVPVNSVVVNVDDIAGTAIAVATSSNLDGSFDFGWDANDFQPEPLNRHQSGLVWPTTRLRAVDDQMFPVSPLGRATVQVTAVFGFSTAVPDAIVEATLLQASRLFSRRNSPQGIVGFSDIGAVRVTRLDYDVQGLLAPYRKNPMGYS